LVMDVLVPPIHRPLEGIIEDPIKIASLVAGSKLQYGVAITKSVKQGRDGIEHLLHANQHGRASIATADAEKVAKVTEKKKAAEAAVKQKAGGKGGGSAAEMMDMTA